MKAVLDADPMNASALHHFHAERLERHEYDGAWCYAAVLAFLGKATEQGTLPTLDQRFKQDHQTCTLALAKSFFWSARVLGMPVVELYVRTDLPDALTSAPAITPTSIAGAAALTGLSNRELVFLCTKHLCDQRSAVRLRVFFPSVSELRILIFSALRLAAPKIAVPAELEKAVQVTAQELEHHFDSRRLESVGRVVKRWVADGEKTDVRDWIHAAELTACRAGLIASGDLASAKFVLEREVSMPGELTLLDKLRDLVRFAVSDDHLAVRKELGIAIRE
jgi:hypothetical protein